MTTDTETWSFEYDANGMRTQRSNGSKTFRYVYSGSQLTAMMYSWYKFLFTYDAAGKPLTLEYHDTHYCQAHAGGSCGSVCETYYYVTNLQGDVIALLDSSGNKVAEYAYDAWGNHVKTPSSFIGNYNPLRYRGYVYDRETCLYYLQSRYYNPQIGRFISADAYVSTGHGTLGNNMFAYCCNNPIMYIDSSGDCPILTVFLIGAGLGFLAVSLSVMPSKEEHYSRNDNQEEVLEMDPQDIIDSDDWIRQSDWKNRYHRHTVGEQGADARNNVKYMTKDGKKEVVIDLTDTDNPKIVTDPFNVGTYNYGTGLTHFALDMLPYYIYGNSEADSGIEYFWNRLVGA